MTKHVLKRCGIYAFAADGPDVEDVGTARTFGSRLSALVFLENRFGENAAELLNYELVKLDAVGPKPHVPSLADFPLLFTDPLDCVRWIAETHERYCDKLEAWLKHAIGLETPQRPTCQIGILAPKWAGIYRGGSHTCTYPAAYALLNPDFATMIAHEVVHGYQHQFTGAGTGHGGDFYALMRHAADMPVTRHTHTYDVAQANALAEVLHPLWMQRREAGQLAALPCVVLHEKMADPGQGDEE